MPKFLGKTPPTDHSHPVRKTSSYRIFESEHARVQTLHPAKRKTAEAAAEVEQTKKTGQRTEHANAHTYPPKPEGWNDMSPSMKKKWTQRHRM